MLHRVVRPQTEGGAGTTLATCGNLGFCSGACRGAEDDAASADRRREVRERRSGGRRHGRAPKLGIIGGGGGGGVVVTGSGERGFGGERGDGEKDLFFYMLGRMR